MRTFDVLCRVDAYVDYVAKVGAHNAKDAAERAYDNPDRYNWEELGPVEFDARGYVALDAKGDELDSTRCGYFG